MKLKHRKRTLIFFNFHYSDSALHRDEWNEKLDKIFKEYAIGNGIYQKNYEDIYDMVNTYGDVNAAIQNAKHRMSEFRADSDKPSEFDPGTTVYKLVEALKGYLEE